MQLSQIGDIPCLCLPKFLALEGAKSSLGLQNLTLGVQVQPQNNTKCRPWAVVNNGVIEVERPREGANSVDQHSRG